MVNNPVVSSMRSRHTGQVGSSTRAGVGGASGLADSVVDGTAEEDVAVVVASDGGVNGSFVMSGKLDGSPLRPGVWN